MRERCLASNGKTVSTTGCIEFQPNAINVIPSRAVFTVDVRNPDEEALCAEEKALALLACARVFMDVMTDLAEE